MNEGEDVTTGFASTATVLVENAQLIALLERHGIEWRLQSEQAQAQVVPTEQEPSRFTTGEKVALFRRLFQGRNDVYPIR